MADLITYLPSEAESEDSPSMLAGMYRSTAKSLAAGSDETEAEAVAAEAAAVKVAAEPGTSVAVLEEEGLMEEEEEEGRAEE